jgi:TrmH family RNA methyltransferase
MFLVEGPHAVSEALASAQHRVEELFVTDHAADRDVDILRAADGAGIRITEVGDRVAAALSDTVTPQGLVAVVRRSTVSLSEVAARQPRLVVVLTDVADPGNAGTVIRTADAAGADAVVIAGHGVDPFNPKCVRAAAGSLFHLPVVAHADSASASDLLRAAGLRTVATVLGADHDLYDAAAAGDLDGPTAWLFGNEAHGVPAEVAAGADLTVSIPIYGQAESLNLATAAAVCLYASAQAQRRAER